MKQELEKRPPPPKEIRLSPHEVIWISEGPEGEESFTEQIIANEKAGLPANHGIPPSPIMDIVKARIAYYRQRDAERAE